jgi:hypothetical protein
MSRALARLEELAIEALAPERSPRGDGHQGRPLEGSVVSVDVAVLHLDNRSAADRLAGSLSEAQKKYLEAEQKSTFVATVVTANHKIKQPLTLMSLSSAALKREINKDVISKEAVIKRLNYIDSAIKEISNVLNQLNTIKKPVFSDYVKDIKMIECEDEQKIRPLNTSG